MGEYFIPLKMLLPGAVHLPLDKIPDSGKELVKALDRIGVVDFKESWNDTHVTIEGRGVIEGEIAISIGGFSLILGTAAGGLTEFKFQLAFERRSVVRAAIEAGVKAIVKDAKKEEDVDVDATPQMYPADGRLTKHVPH